MAYEHVLGGENITILKVILRETRKSIFLVYSPNRIYIAIALVEFHGGITTSKSDRARLTVKRSDAKG